MHVKKIAYLSLPVLTVWAALSLQVSCTKTVTKTVTDTVRHAWQPIPYFSLNILQVLNSANQGDTMLVAAGKTGFVQGAVNHSKFDWFSSNFLPGTSLDFPAIGTPFVNDHLCAYATANSMNVSSVPVYSQYSFISYKPVRTDTAINISQWTVASFPSLAYPASSYPVIRSKYMLMPVEADSHWRKIRIDLVSFDSSKVLSPFGFGDTPVGKRLYPTPAPGTIGFASSNYFCAVFYDKFFVELEGQFYRIDTLGNIKAFGYRPAATVNNWRGLYNMFTIGNRLFINSGGLIFSSDDQGENWTLFNDYSNSTVGWLIFRNVGTDLYATFADLDMQIWKVTLQGNNFVLSEINNDGLEGNLITSITPCGKYVFVTTPSGVFYREKKLFDQLKTPIR